MLKKTKKIAIVVNEKFNSLNAYKDDILLKQKLEKRGYLADIVVWSDESIDFSKYDLAIIRSCWGYDEELEYFLDRMNKISSETNLVNNFETIKKNSDKLYLFELEKLGIDIIPMEVINEVNEEIFPIKYDKIVVKPNVSASGKDTYRFNREEKNLILQAIGDIISKGKKAILQKYMENIEEHGERSTTVINSVPCFTMKKTPAKGDFLVHEHFGGKDQRHEITVNERNFVDKVLKSLEEVPLYLRIDYIEDFDGKIYLLELEEIEPCLYLSENIEGLNLLIDGIETILGDNDIK